MYNQKKIDVIIPARMGSSRFPGKTLSDLNGRPMISRQIDRIRHSKYVDRIVLATTNLECDDILESWCTENKILCFRGSSENVLNRVYSTAKFYNSEYIVEILGDNPLVDSEVINEAISKYFSESNIDFVTTLSREYKNFTNLDKYFPVGVRVQMLSYDLLKKLESIVSDDYNKEHSTSYIISNQNEFNVHFLEANNKFQNSYLPNYNFAVNTEQQLSCVNDIFKNFENNNFSLEEVVGLVERNYRMFDNLKIN
jgi:spore coat polysaccharide biosynthesis protein SpsF